MTGDRMHAAVVHALGDTPKYDLFPPPEPTDDTSVVTVGAAALKPSDRLAAAGVHYAPASVPFVAGLDGVGRLADGTRIGFMLPTQPHGGFAERTLVRTGQWLPVPEGVDDVTAAAFLNPGMAAWKTVVWEGEAGPGSRVLVLGATSTAGRIAAQLAVRLGSTVVVTGRDQDALDGLVAKGAHASVRLDRPRDLLVADLAAHGPYDLVADFLWGAPAEAAIAAVARSSRSRERIRYICVGMAAGESAGIPAIVLRQAPIHLVGSGAGRPLPLDRAAEAFADLLDDARRSRVTLDLDLVPLAEVERVWNSAPDGRRVVLVPDVSR